MMQYQLEQIGYDAILIRFINGENAKLLPVIQSLSQQLKHTASISPAIIDIIPSYQSILISYHLLKIEPDYLLHCIHQLVKQTLNNKRNSHHIDEVNIITLPVCYHESLAPDLINLSRYCGLTVDEVVRIHSTTIYSCYAVGFMPGFAYLGDVDARIQMPRQENPREKVVKGSVGIADNQTAIYPKTSPGGWQIIGRCPAPLLPNLALVTTLEECSQPEIAIENERNDKKEDTTDSQHANLSTLLTVGNCIKFEPISLQEFKHLNTGINSL